MQSRDAMVGWPPVQRRKWISWTILHSLLTRCSEMPVFLARVGSPDILWSVNKLARSSHKMDKSLWQTLGSLDLVHSSHKWIQAVLTMQNRIVERLWFCRRPWRLEVNIRRNLLHFRKSHVRANKLDVHRNRLQCHTVLQKLKSSLSMQVYAWTGILALDLWDLVIDVFHSLPNQTNKTKDVRLPRSANTQPNMRKQIPTTHTNLDLINIDHVPSSGTHSGSNAMLFVFEDTEAVISNDNKSPKSRNETCVKNPQRCFGLVVSQD